jgi:hypothetical protein
MLGVQRPERANGVHRSPCGRSNWTTGARHIRQYKSKEALIRTLSVSLVAVAAIAASLLLTRNREGDAPVRVLPAGGEQPCRLQLDAIRAAGL